MEQEILAAFDEIHNLNVLHGDVHPANILVAEDGKVWIVDFEDGGIIGEGEEERKSDEINEVCRILREIKKGPILNGCQPSRSLNPTPWLPSLPR